MHRVIVVGSPRAEGRSAALADELFQACIEECPEDGVSIVSVASVNVAPCVGCDGCRPTTEPPEPPEEGDPLAPCAAIAASTACQHSCIIADDMDEVRKHLDAADELIVVCPVYFASAPAQMKALMDRLQPYFWSDVREQPKRPATLHVVGDGGDPHGFEPLVGTVRSAFGVAGFRLERVLDWVGKMSEDGEILAEAEELLCDDGPQGSACGGDAPDSALEADVSSLEREAAGPAPRSESRPKLDLSAPERAPREHGGGKRSRKPHERQQGGHPKKGGKAPKKRG